MATFIKDYRVVIDAPLLETSVFADEDGVYMHVVQASDAWKRLAKQISTTEDSEWPEGERDITKLLCAYLYETQYGKKNTS